MKIAVLGSGNGGCAVAADFGFKGHEVYLYDFEIFDSNIKAINEKGGISVNGNDLSGFAQISYAGHDIKKVVSDADLIIVVGPAFSTIPFAEGIKGIIKKGQKIVVCPGSCGGSLIFKRILGYALEDESVIVSETSTLPYACRITEPGTVQIFLKLKGGVFLSSIPSKHTEDIIRDMIEVYPMLSSAKNILQTILQNANPIIHPAVTLMNAALIERTEGNFLFYEEGIMPSVGKLIEGLDKERMLIGEKLNISILPDPVISKLQGYMQEENYVNGYRTAKGFKGIKAQSKLDHRYFSEDVGYGLVFMSELAKEIGAETPLMDSLINLASVIMNKPYRTMKKRTLKTLGLNKDIIQTL